MGKSENGERMRRNKQRNPFFGISVNLISAILICIS